MNQKTVLKINEETIKNTLECKKSFSCLSGMSLCQVDLSVGDKIHFVKCMSNEPCNYRVSFGYSFVCLCPVRKEIFNRYNI